MMNLENPNGVESSVSKNTKQRRTFLKRATAGAVIASIPGRSAWAGIAGSIVASGHGSDANGGVCTELLSHGYWKNNLSDNTTTFASIFGGPAIGNLTGQNVPPSGYYDTSITLLEVLNAEGAGPNGFGGPGNVNCHMAAMYLNALNHDPSGLGDVYYPVAAQHGSAELYAQYLYDEAVKAPEDVGVLLNKVITDYHSGRSICAI